MTKRTNRIERLADGHYMTTYVDVCRNCTGSGGQGRQFVSGQRTWDWCPICEGSGRVVVTKEIHIKVEPYKTT
ncbi:MAG: hypothetical protein RBS55_10935 [Bacteroidales bacterium]|jgi:DnaJ-class molecular chaperone|nr:hypothetical protein [Bacteroidales bacterium]